MAVKGQSWDKNIYKGRFCKYNEFYNIHGQEIKHIGGSMLQEAVEFGEFLAGQREQKNVSRDALGEGIFTANMMGRLERGERYPDKMTRDRLVARIGESGYDYEQFLTPEEYEDWEKRRDILDALDNLELEKAEVMIAKNYDSKEKVVRQFWMTMHMQWLELQEVDAKRRFPVLEEAVKLTVPAVDKKPVSQLLLSVQEFNLVLEYITYKRPENLEEQYLDMMQQVEAKAFDSLSKAMLGAKLALYYCKYRDSRAAEQERMELLPWVKKNLEVCTKGIEWLRDRNKIYFAWELLALKKGYLQWLLGNKTQFSKEEAEVYEKELQQTTDFYELLDGLYEEYQIPKATNLYTCFCREYEIYCINEVIQARRMMFGVSRKELEEELICSLSTMKRLEAKKTIQLANAQRLFKRFHLSMEMTRAQLVTHNQEVIRLEEEYREAYDQREYERAALALQRIKELVNLDELINKQYIDYGELELRYRCKKISKEHWLQGIKEILGYTVPYEAAIAKIENVRLRNGRFRKGRKYLTNQEVTILYHIIKENGTNMENALWQVLQEYFEYLEKKCTIAPILGMYGLVMNTVASYKGNMGLYEESSAINRKILRESLRVRNLSYVRANLYDLLWNDYMQKGLPMTVEDPEWKKGILHCLTADIFCKDEWRSAKMRKRLET